MRTQVNTPTNTFATKPTLTGKLVELRPFNEESTQAMMNILAEPEVLIKTGAVHSTQEALNRNERTVKHAKSWYDTRNNQNNRLDLAIYSLKHNEYVGEAVFNDYSPQNKSVNYRIIIGQKGRGHGLGTETTQMMVNYAFAVLKLNRIELEVFDFNARARYVYTSCGFVCEGRRREALYYDGKYHDSMIKAILRKDWEQAHSPASLSTASLPVVKI
ncbi:GNAT family N-acetyltransferase [Rothia sp. CCM 9418]|uniref:GNAT family N-acetyltransferase n=1 Tax=Rothia sp. CCM 9418 TaxID=3402661 RepID=UPI003AD9A5CB